MLGKTVQIHAEKIYLEFPVDVMEFIFVFSVAAFEIFLINLLEIVKVVRTFGIHAFVDYEMFAVFLVNQRMIGRWMKQRVRRSLSMPLIWDITFLMPQMGTLPEQVRNT